MTDLLYLIANYVSDFMGCPLGSDYGGTLIEVGATDGHHKLPWKLSGRAVHERDIYDTSN